MLQPDYFNDKTDTLLEYYRTLEDWILKDIADRLLKNDELTPTADRELFKLEQMGLHKHEILKKLSAITGKTTKEIRTLLQDAVTTSYNDEIAIYESQGIELTEPLKNPFVLSVMNAEWQKVQGEIENLTQTTIDESASELLKLLNEAELRVSSGVQSYSQAVIDVLDSYASRGVQVSYPKGTKRSLESAVRCAIVTSMNQTAAQVSNAYIKQNNIEYVLVSAHLGARHDKNNPMGLSSHDYWQGKAYKIEGSEQGYPNLLESTGYTIDDNGKGIVVNPLGLHGYNCRHSHQGWFKDLKNPWLDENGNVKIATEESQKIYELQQKQRAYERKIRRTKRELLVKEREINGIAETDIRDMLKEDLSKIENKLTRLNGQYNSFCRANNLTPQYDRIKIAK